MCVSWHQLDNKHGALGKEPLCHGPGETQEVSSRYGEQQPWGWQSTAPGGSFLNNHRHLHSLVITGLDTHKLTELSSNTTDYCSEAVTAGCQKEGCTQLPKQHCKADLERKMLPSSGSTLGASGAPRTRGWLKQSIHMQAAILKG